MSVATSWAWTIATDQQLTNVLATFTTQNPSYTFPAIGSYYAQLIATNAQGSNSTGPVAVDVTAAGGWSFARRTTTQITSGTTAPMTLPTVEAGNLLIVNFFATSPANVNVTEFHDQFGNTYTAAGPKQSVSWASNKQFWGIAVSGGSNVLTNCTFDISGTPASMGSGYIVVDQFTRLAGTIGLADVSSTASAGSVGGPVDSGPVTSSVGNVLLYGSHLADSIGTTQPVESPPWVLQDNNLAYKLNQTSGTYRYRPTYPGSQLWVAQLLAFTTDAIPPADNPPTIAFVTPTSSPTYNAGAAATLSIAGTAADDIGLVRVAWSNDRGGGGIATGTTSWSQANIPLVEGLNNITVRADDTGGQSTYTNLAVTRTTPPPAVAAPPRFMRGFGVRGVGPTDTIQTALTAHSVARTWMMWLRREKVTLPATVFTKSTQAIQTHAESFIAALDGGLASRHFKRQWSGGTADWGYYTTAPVGTRFCVVIKYSTSAPANVPIIKVNDVVQTLFTVRQPGGGETVVNNAASYMLGNFPGGAGDWGGDIAKWTIYNRLTTDQEDTDFYEGDNPLTIGTAPVSYVALDGTANEPDAISPFTASTIVGTVVQDYNAGPTATVDLSVTEGNPATSTAYQVTATTTGTVNRVEFDVGGVLTRTDTTAPYTLFVSPTLLGAGAHTIDARVYVAAGGSPADTDTLVVTEPSVSSGAWLATYEVDRVTNADGYKLYLDGVLHQSVSQPASGNPLLTASFTGASAVKLIQYSSVTAAVESAKASITIRYIDPSATAVEGFREISRPYVVGTTTWTPTFRWERKGLAVSYNIYVDGSLAGNVLQPAGTARPTFVASFTGTSVVKTIAVEPVFAGGAGVRSAVAYEYVAPAADAPVGFQERSRTFTP